MTSLQLAYATERELERAHRIEERETERHNREQEKLQAINLMNQSVSNMNNAVSQLQQNYNAQSQIAATYANYYAKREEVDRKYGLEGQKMILEAGLKAKELDTQFQSMANERDYKQRIAAVQEEQNRLTDEWNQHMENYHAAQLDYQNRELYQRKLEHSNRVWENAEQTRVADERNRIANEELFLKQEAQPYSIEQMKRYAYGLRVQNIQNTIKTFLNPLDLHLDKLGSAVFQALPLMLGGM